MSNGPFFVASLEGSKKLPSCIKSLAACATERTVGTAAGAGGERGLLLGVGIEVVGAVGIGGIVDRGGGVGIGVAIGVEVRDGAGERLTKESPSSSKESSRLGDKSG